MPQHRHIWMPVLAALLIVVATAGANVPRAFNFQGRITDGGEGPVNLEVKFWDAQTGGEVLFSELHEGVPLHNGIFSIRIGSVAQGVPDAALDAPQIWLGVSVDGGEELPRTRLVSTPFAVKADSAERLVAPGTFHPVLYAVPEGGIVLEEGIDILDSFGNAGVHIALDIPWPEECYGTETHMNNLLSLSGPEQLSILLDTNDRENGNDCDSRILMYDASGKLSVRVHSDLTNDAAEISMFAEDSAATIRETVDIRANSPGGTANTGGRLELRRVQDPDSMATNAVRLSAAHSDYSGGVIEVFDNDGDQRIVLAGESQTGTITVTGYNGHEVRLLSNGTPGISLNRSDSVAGVFINGFADGGQVKLNSATEQNVIVLDAEDGKITTKVLEITGADLAEKFATSEEVKPGMVVAIDPKNPGQLCLARGAYNRCVAGVVSGANDLSAGAILGNLPGHENAPPIALSGRVWCWCDASYGVIAPGDLLTTSGTPGHAMKVTDHPKAQGAIIGKAMTSLESSRGMVLVLVSLQ